MTTNGASVRIRIAHHGSSALPDGGSGGPPPSAVGSVTRQSPPAPVEREPRPSVGREPGADHGQEERLPVRSRLVQIGPAAHVHLQRANHLGVVAPGAIVREEALLLRRGQQGLQPGFDVPHRDVIPLGVVPRRTGHRRRRIRTMAGPGIEAAAKKRRRT
jgi:hypothetical protein